MPSKEYFSVQKPVNEYLSVQKPVNELRDEFMWLLQGGLDEDAVPGATLYNLDI